MVTVSVKQLISAIEEADIFKLPNMSAGTEYIYDNLYRRLSLGEEVRLSDIDFDAFRLDDINTVRDIYSDVLEANESKADKISYTLRSISPVAVTAAFV